MRYARYSILLIDDLGKYKPDKLNFSQRILYEIINLRYVQRRITIFTSNLTNNGLQDYLGDSTYDRVLGMIRSVDKKGKVSHPIYELRGESKR
jgi:DNA replication protein DnaC